ncbi:MAG: GNAT family N-acetyltransferase [Acidobacteria bacterium]|nr:GNAT family N-acetyltransferase [Acidobacteriota bacterium]
MDQLYDYVLFSDKKRDFRLRPVEHRDIESLRVWKNLNKRSFFLQRDIAPSEQEKWFKSFMNRQGDHMFIVEQTVDGSWEGIGCMGFRFLPEEGCTDIYNIIRSRRIDPSSFSMGDVFQTMLAFARDSFPGFPIRCKVLTSNPAIKWYESNGFSTIGGAQDYCLMQLDANRASEFTYVRNTLGDK